MAYDPLDPPTGLIQNTGPRLTRKEYTPYQAPPSNAPGVQGMQDTGLGGSAANSNVTQLRNPAVKAPTGGNTGLTGYAQNDLMKFHPETSGTYDLSVPKDNSIDFKMPKADSKLRLTNENAYPRSGGQFDIFGGGGKIPEGPAQWSPSGSNPNQGRLPMQEYVKPSGIGMD